MSYTTLNLDKEKTLNEEFHLIGREKKPGIAVMYAFLFGSWLMVALFLLASIILLNYNWPWACLMLASTVAFGWYLKKMDARLDSQKGRVFELRSNSKVVRLDVFDRKTGQHFKRVLEWADIRWAEVYRYVDEPTLVLQGSLSSIEIPLWAFGPQKKALMQSIIAKQIPIVRIP